MQQLGAAAYDAVPLLADSGQVPGDVDQHHQRHAERVAHPDEAGRLLRRGGVQAAAEAEGVVGDDADRAATEPPEGGHEVGSPPGVQLDDGALVEHALDERVHVVGPLGRLRQQRREVASHDVVGGQPALRTEQRGKGAASGQRLLLRVGEQMHHAGAPAVRLGASQPEHVDVLAGDRADHVGAGHEDPPLRSEDHDVGEGGAVRRAAGRRAEHHRDLRDAT